MTSLVRQTLASKTFVLTLGKFSTTIAQGLLLLVIARSEGAYAVGMYTLALALTSPLFLFSHMRAQDVVATSPDPGHAWAAAIRLVLVAGAVAVIAAAAIGWLWPSTQVLSYVLPLAVAKLIDSLTWTCHGYRNAFGLVAQTAASNAVRALLSVVAVAIGTWYSGVTVGLWLMCICSLAQLLLWDVRSMPRGLKGPLALQSLGGSLSLGVVALLLGLHQPLLRGLLDLWVGTAELGVFATVAYVVRTGSVIAQATAQASAHDLRSALEHSPPAGARLALRCGRNGVALGLLMLAIGLPIGPSLLALVFGPEFRPSYELMALVLLAGVSLFGSTAMSTATVATSSRADYLRAVVLSVVSTGLSAVLLIPWLGLAGAGLAWWLGESVKLTVMVATSWRGARVGSLSSTAENRGSAPCE